MTAAGTPPVTLGASGITIPPLGVGTWSWGDARFWGYGKEYGRDEIADAFAASVAAGITLFDTAEIYGQGESERLLGALIRERGTAASAPPVIATKFAPLPWRFRRARAAPYAGREPGTSRRRTRRPVPDPLPLQPDRHPDADGCAGRRRGRRPGRSGRGQQLQRGADAPGARGVGAARRAAGDESAAI